MKTDLNNIRKYMEGKNTETTKAFVAGYCRAMSDCGYAVTDYSDPQRYVRQQILREEALRYKRGWDEAEMICRTFGVPKMDFRAMMLDCDKVDDYGREINYDGKLIKDPAEHKRYLMTDYVGEDAEEVAYVDLVNAVGDHYRVYRNNLPFIGYLLWQDMMIGDPINKRYVEEAQSGGMLEDFANVIRCAFRECPHKWLTPDPTLPEAKIAAKMRAMAGREVPSLPHFKQAEMKHWSPNDYQRLPSQTLGAMSEFGFEDEDLKAFYDDLIGSAQAVAKRERLSKESFNAMVHNAVALACEQMNDFGKVPDGKSDVLPDGAVVLPSDVPSEDGAEDPGKKPKRRGRPKSDGAGKKAKVPKKSTSSTERKEKEK